MPFASGSPGVRLPTGGRELVVVLCARPWFLVTSEEPPRRCRTVGPFMTLWQTLARERNPREQEKNLFELSVGEGRAAADSASKVRGTQPFRLFDHMDRSLLQEGKDSWVAADVKPLKESDFIVIGKRSQRPMSVLTW